MAKTNKNTQIKTTADLRQVLIETIQGVRSGEVDYKQGATMASLSKAVIQSAKLDFDVVRYYKGLELDDGSSVKAIELTK